MIWDSHLAMTGLMLYPQYLELRFSKLTRQLITATFIMNTCLMLPIFMFIPSLAFSQGLLHTLILQKFRNYRSFLSSISNRIEYSLNQHGCLLNLCVLYNVGWHQGSRVDRCGTRRYNAVLGDSSGSSGHIADGRTDYGDR